MKKLDYIDATRGLAIIGVLMVHCSQHGNNLLHPIVSNIFGNGARGVQLFYVASAFTLFLSLANRSGREEGTYRNFFIRRLFRIAPMYYIGVAYYLWQNGTGPGYWLGDAPGISGANVASNLLFLHGFNPYWITSVVPGGWSIAVEMLFYCLIPFLFMRIKNLNQAMVFFIITLLFKLLLHAFFLKFRLISSERLWDEYLFFYLPAQLPVFACGIVLYYLITTPRGEWQVKPFNLLLLSTMFIANLLAGVNFLFPTHILFAMGFVAFVYTLSQKQFSLIVNPVTTYIGKVSYSLYIVHLAVLYWMEHWGLADFITPTSAVTGLANYALRFIFLLVVAVGVATVCYRLVELPLQQVGKKLIRRLEEKKRVTAAQ